MDAEKLHHLRNRSLLINVKDKIGAISALATEGFNATVTDDGLIEITAENAVLHPENVNSNLVTAGYSPAMLKVEEEELESYFLRIIGKKGVV